MRDTLQSRACLMLMIIVSHAALIWLAVVRLHPEQITLPQPLPVIMAQMLPQAASETPMPEPAPQPVIKPAPQPKLVPKPVKPFMPQTLESERALSTPKPVEPAAEAAPSTTPPVLPAPATSAAPVASQSPAAPVVTAPLTPPRFNAAYLNNPPPVYPPMLRRAGEEGRVVLRVFVTPHGLAGEVRVLNPSSSPQFDEAALAAVRKWRFVPARRGDTPVAEWVQVPIEFKLN